MFGNHTLMKVLWQEKLKSFKKSREALVFFLPNASLDGIVNRGLEYSP